MPLAFSGSMALVIPGFASLTLGDFALAALAPVVTPSLTTTEILLGTSNASAFLGANSPTQTGVNISGASLAMVLVIRTGANLNGLPAFSFALQTSGGTATLDNFPDLTLAAGSLAVRVNTTGAGVDSQTITTAGGPVSIGFTDGSNNTDDQRNLLDVEGNITLNVVPGGNTFASLTGDFGFKIANITDNTGAIIGTRFIVGAQNINAVLGTTAINATITGASLGLVLDYQTTGTVTTTSYALLAKGGTDALNGVTGLTLSGSGLTVQVIRGLAPAALSGFADSVHTNAGTVAINLSGLGTSTSTADITAFSGTATLAVQNFLTLSGNFAFTQQADSTNNQTKLLVGASRRVNGFWGTPDRSVRAEHQ